MRVERALLALFLLDPDLIDNVSRHLLPEDFSVEEHRIIYAAMLGIMERGLADIDLISLLSAIEREGNLTKQVEYMTMALVGVM
jgi:replicative DNA helicase